ncbi:MAG: DNA-processing protein DprA [Stomatobaculum sp.]
MQKFELLFYLSAILKMHRREVQKLSPLFFHLSLPDLCALSASRLHALGLPEKYAEGFRHGTQAGEKIQRESCRLRERGIRFITEENTEWPDCFRVMTDAPLWLYVRGALPSTNCRLVSVVGSRSASRYGLRMAEFIAGTLAEQGVGIVSGLASGIDIASQRAALQAGGTSHAILGCGANICYPKESYEIFRALCDKHHGGIISEYPPDSPALRWHFPERNRLIAAFGACLILVEARGMRSGSMITVDFALEQGKEVFAVPGRITDPMSRGCNELIGNGASILTGPDDILELLGLKKDHRLPPKRRSAEGLNGEEQRIYALIGEEPCFLDDIIRKTGLPTGHVMSVLLKLELEGFVMQPSGNYYTAALYPQS